MNDPPTAPPPGGQPPACPPNPPSFTPSPAVPYDEADGDSDAPQSRSQETVQYHDPEDETEEPVLNEEEAEHLQSEDSEPTSAMNRNLRNLRSSRLDGYVEVFRMRRNGIFKQIHLQLPAMVFA